MYIIYIYIWEGGRGKHAYGGGGTKFTKYNKIINNSENLTGLKLLLGGSPLPLIVGLN